MTPGGVSDDIQLPQMVVWLEEQRKIDKGQLLAIQQDIERLGLSVRELTAHISRIQDDLVHGQSRLVLLGPVEDGLRQVREDLLVLQQRLDETRETQEKGLLVRQAEAERDHRTLVDLGQQIAESRRLVETEQARVRTLADDVKRMKSLVETTAGQLDSADKSISGAISRVHLLEETVRRQDSRLTALEKTMETLQSDYSRMFQWQQAADLRWSRQLSNWQQQMDDWGREAEDRVKLIQQFIKQLASVKEEVQELRIKQGENHQRSEDHVAELMRIESARLRDREEFRRVEQALEAQRRRIDEQVGLVKQLQEQTLQDVQELASVSARVEAEQRQAEELGSQVAHLDQRQRQFMEDVDQLRRDVREQRQDFAQLVQRWSLQVEEDRRKLEEQLEEIQRLEEQQKLRQIAELERQIIEIRESFSKTRSS